MAVTKLATAHLPHSAGVYFFKDATGAVLYIGKAKDLKKRVLSYFNGHRADNKLVSLLQEAVSIDHIVTSNETEALLLEAQLVKEHQPYYNTLLKEGQPFLYLMVTNDPLPQLELARVKEKKGTYFGPFIHKSSARNVYNYLIKTFQLKLCTKTIANGCLDYHLGICAGSCMPTFAQDDYRARLLAAQLALKQDQKAFRATLQALIKTHIDTLAYEKARALYRYLESIDTIFATINTHFTEKKFATDVFVVTTPPPSALDYAVCAKELKDMLGLASTPRSIDCFDISHFQSSALVGSCVRFTDGLPDKRNFRHFIIRTLTQQNDYAALQEIVARRYKDPDTLPDLIVIDGGKGQLSAILTIIPQAQVLSLAKREERIFSPTLAQGVVLDVHTKVGKLLIALRDYAHHFAVSFHRKKRSKALLS